MRKRGRKGGNMGRAPCCNKGEVKKGAWTPEEDKLLVDYITKHGHGTWRSFPKLAGLRRCGKSCRLRWTNYLRPDIKRGAFTYEEEQTIFNLHRLHGNKWAAIASRLPGRTDNEIKNFWNSHLRKRIPKPTSPSTSAETETAFSPTGHMAEMENRDTTVEPMDPMLLIPDGSSENNNINGLHDWGSSNGGELAIPTLGAMKFESESCDYGVKERFRVKEEAEEIMINGSESRNSFEADNSSDITLDLLLDFPNDGEYLQYE